MVLKFVGQREAVADMYYQCPRCGWTGKIANTVAIEKGGWCTVFVMCPHCPTEVDHVFALPEA